MSYLDFETAAHVDEYSLTEASGMYDLDDEEQLAVFEQRQREVKLRRRHGRPEGRLQREALFLPIDLDLEREFLTHVAVGSGTFALCTSKRQLHVYDVKDQVPHCTVPLDFSRERQSNLPDVLGLANIGSALTGRSAEKQVVSEPVARLAIDPLGRHVLVTFRRAPQALYLHLQPGSAKPHRHVLDLSAVRGAELQSPEPLELPVESVCWNGDNTFEATTGPVLLGTRSGGHIYRCRFDAGGPGGMKRLFTIPKEHDPIVGITVRRDAATRRTTVLVATAKKLYTFVGPGEPEAVFGRYVALLDDAASAGLQEDSVLTVTELDRRPPKPQASPARGRKEQGTASHTLQGVGYHNSAFPPGFVWATPAGVSFGTVPDPRPQQADAETDSDDDVFADIDSVAGSGSASSHRPAKAKAPKRCPPAAIASTVGLTELPVAAQHVPVGPAQGPASPNVPFSPLLGGARPLAIPGMTGTAVPPRAAVPIPGMPSLAATTSSPAPAGPPTPTANSGPPSGTPAAHPPAVVHGVGSNGFFLAVTTSEAVNVYAHPVCLPWQPLPSGMQRKMSWLASPGRAQAHADPSPEYAASPSTGSAGGPGPNGSFRAETMSEASEQTTALGHSHPKATAVAGKELATRLVARFPLQDFGDAFRRGGGAGVVVDPRGGSKLYLYTPLGVWELRQPPLRRMLLPLFLDHMEQQQGRGGEADAQAMAKAIAGECESLRDLVLRREADALLRAGRLMEAAAVFADCDAVAVTDAVLLLSDAQAAAGRQPAAEGSAVGRGEPTPLELFVQQRVARWLRSRKTLTDRSQQLFCLVHWLVLLLVDRCNRAAAAERSDRLLAAAHGSSDAASPSRGQRFRAATLFGLEASEEGLLDPMSSFAPPSVAAAVQATGAALADDGEGAAVLEEIRRTLLRGGDAGLVLEVAGCAHSLSSRHAAEAALATALQQHTDLLDFERIKARLLGTANASLISLLCTLLRRFDDVLRYLLVQGAYGTAAQLLTSYCADDVAFAPLWLQHARVLWRQRPVKFVRDGLIPHGAGLGLTPLDFLSALHDYAVEHNEADEEENVALAYLGHAIAEGVLEPSVHSLYLDLLARHGDDDTLTRFAAASPLLPLQPALRTCLRFTRVAAVGELYLRLGCPEDAVSYALANGAIPVAKECAGRIEDPAVRKAQWQRVAQYVVSRQGGPQNSLRLLRDAPELGMSDVLPHFSDDVLLVEFKDELLRSVKDLAVGRLATFEAVDARQGLAAELRSDTRRQQRSVAAMPGGERCDVCRQPVLSRDLLVFPRCHHAFHVTCHHTAHADTLGTHVSGTTECFLCARRSLRSLLTKSIDCDAVALSL